MQPTQEAFKDIARLAIFAAIGAVVSVVLGNIANFPQTTTTVIITFVLRAIDSYIHNNDGMKANGLTPF